MRSLLNKFEPVAPPTPVRKDRVKSTVDPVRQEIFGEAAQVRDIARAVNVHKAPIKKLLPRECASDTDEERELKRTILARDEEIREAVAKLSSLSERLERLVDQFSSSVVVDEASPRSPLSPPPVAAFAADSSTSSPRSTSLPQDRPERHSASAPVATSLEAILAAARSGNSSSRSGGERPKYARMLRDLK